MAKKPTFRETPIASIPADEPVLLEGLMQAQSLYSTKKTRYTYKYALTEKGVWMKSKGFLFLKSKESFLPYTGMAGYKRSNYIRLQGFIFFPASGKKPGNRIFFDKTEAAVEIFDRHIKNFDKPQDDA